MADPPEKPPAPRVLTIVEATGGPPGSVPNALHESGSWAGETVRVVDPPWIGEASSGELERQLLAEAGDTERQPMSERDLASTLHGARTVADATIVRPPPSFAPAAREGEAELEARLLAEEANTTRMEALSVATSMIQDVATGLELRPDCPAMIGRYHVVSRLGCGGMAEVFRAQQTGPGGFTKGVVVKRMLPHLADDERFVAMFLREARLAARLNHTHVVQIYELGCDRGAYFIAMEHVEGLGLNQLARCAWGAGELLPVEVVVMAIADAALGLHYVHTAADDLGLPLGLVHRDISPDNLMITRDGLTKILDFGIASAHEAASHTRPGEIKGKLPFMSPEHVRAETLDHRADLYALGVCLYWLLTRRFPFPGENAYQTMGDVLHKSVTSPRSINPGIPAALDDIILRLLAKHPGDRIQSGEELHERLVAAVTTSRPAVSTFVERMFALVVPKDAVGKNAPAARRPSGRTDVTTTPGGGRRG